MKLPFVFILQPATVNTFLSFYYCHMPSQHTGELLLAHYSCCVQSDEANESHCECKLWIAVHYRQVSYFLSRNYTFPEHHFAVNVDYVHDDVVLVRIRTLNNLMLTAQ